jgi:hypothetical protein
MFVVPWATLLIAGLTFVLSHRDMPRGIIPLILILAGVTFVGFCLIAGVALVTESEGITIAATVVCNSSYSIAWYFIIRNPAIEGGLKSPVPVWSPPVLHILAGEFVVIALMLGLTLFLQSRKRSFV